MKSKPWARITFLLAVLQVLLILVSWIVSSAAPQTPIRSMLSSEGIRWFMGRFAENLSSPYLAWLLLLSIAYGVLHTSGLYNTITAWTHGQSIPYRKRFALFLSFMLLLFFILVVLYLTCVQHAVLLSATGHLFPSSFGSALVPIVAFVITTMSVTYGLLSGQYSSWQHAFEGMVFGLQYTLPLVVVYVFLAQFIFSLIYVFA